jgi:hypothetical protein
VVLAAVLVAKSLMHLNELRVFAVALPALKAREFTERMAVGAAERNILFMDMTLKGD